MIEPNASARETLLLALRLRAQSVSETDGAIMREAADMIEWLVIEAGHQRAALESIASDAPRRCGWDQTDIEYEPALSAEEAFHVAGSALARLAALRATLPAEGRDSAAAAQSSRTPTHG